MRRRQKKRSTTNAVKAHTEIKKKISAEISDLAKQAENVDASFWHGEPWEQEFRAWNIVLTMD